MTVFGQDWSSYQASSPSTAGLSFAFIKVTEGLGYVNPKWKAQAAAARAGGLVVGLYHYPHITNSASAEADYFLAQVGTLQPGDLLCLDWEWYGQTGVTNAQARAYKDAWLARTASKTTHKVGAYCDRTNWLDVDTDSNCGDFLWIADVTTAGKPRIQHPWTFHQYSSGGGIDHDVANFASAAALRAWAGVAPTPTPTPPAPKPTPDPTPTPTPAVEDAMPLWITAPIAPGADAVVALVPHGDAWKAYPNRKLHLGFDKITIPVKGEPGPTALVRVAIHNGVKWGEPTEHTVTAAGSTLDVTVTNSDVKVSLQTDTPGVSYAIEVW